MKSVCAFALVCCLCAEARGQGWYQVAPAPQTALPYTVQSPVLGPTPTFATPDPAYDAPPVAAMAPALGMPQPVYMQPVLVPAPRPITPPAAMLYQYGTVGRIVTYPATPAPYTAYYGYGGAGMSWQPLLVSPAPVYVYRPVTP